MFFFFILLEDLDQKWRTPFYIIVSLSETIYCKRFCWQHQAKSRNLVCFKMKIFVIQLYNCMLGLNSIYLYVYQLCMMLQPFRYFYNKPIKRYLSMICISLNQHAYMHETFRLCVNVFLLWFNKTVWNQLRKVTTNDENFNSIAQTLMHLSLYNLTTSKTSVAQYLLYSTKRLLVIIVTVHGTLCTLQGWASTS